MTDLDKFLSLLDEWGLVNENLHVYENEEDQCKHVWAFTDSWVFDKDGKFLYIHDVEFDTYLHRGGIYN